jgi:hypothetical protein
MGNGIVATGVSATALGGALAVVLSFYYRQHGIQLTPEVEQALQTIFTTIVTGASMAAHILVVRLLDKSSVNCEDKSHD